MNVAGYLRVSGKGQIDGDGFERQRQAIARYCDAHSLVIDRFFEEKGVSGEVEAMDRPAFADMILYAKEGAVIPVQAVVVERMDRLARDLMVSEMLITTCRRHNLRVYSADQGVLVDMSDDSTDPTRTLIRQIMGALAQWERTMLVKKLAAARARKRAATGRCGGPLRFGEHINEQSWMKHVAALSYVVGPSELANALNEAGFRTRRGSTWDRRTAWGMQKRIKKYKLATPLDENFGDDVSEP